MERLRISSLGVLPDFLQPQIRVCQDYIILARHTSFEKAKDLSVVPFDNSHFLLYRNNQIPMFLCDSFEPTRTYYWIKAGMNIELMIQMFPFYRNQPAPLLWLHTGKMWLVLGRRLSAPGVRSKCPVWKGAEAGEATNKAAAATPVTANREVSFHVESMLKPLHCR